jgi:hypothetical protein
VAAFGQQALAAARNDEDAVQVAVGEFQVGGVASQLVLVRWPISAMCAWVERAGAVRVRIASGRPSQAQRSVGERVDISRAEALRGLANSGSITNSRWSVMPGSWVVWGRALPRSVPRRRTGRSAAQVGEQAQPMDRRAGGAIRARQATAARRGKVAYRSRDRGWDRAGRVSCSSTPVCRARQDRPYPSRSRQRTERVLDHSSTSGIATPALLTYVPVDSLRLHYS